MSAQIRAFVVARSGLLLATLQTLCGPYFRDTLALRCFAWYTFVIPMRLYASLAILWGLSCLFGRYRFSLGSTWVPLGAILAPLGAILVQLDVSCRLFVTHWASPAIPRALLGSPWPSLASCWPLIGLPLVSS